MKRLSRYGVIDSYTLEELCRKYKMSDAKGRIDLLKRFWNGRNTTQPYPPNLPFEIAVMAVEDPDVGIRQWVARNALYLNFEPLESRRRPLEERYDTDGWPKSSERELTNNLRHDSDAFVRACLHENSNIFVSWAAVFHSATHLERLALMRNTDAASPFNQPLIELLFDPDDKTLAIDTFQRKELVLAYISNRAAQRHSRLAEDRDQYVFGRPPLDDFSYGDREHNWKEQCEHFSKLWRLAQKWPHPVPLLVFYYFGLEDQARTATYKACSDKILQSFILESSVGRLHEQTIALGCKSSDANTSGSLTALVRNRSLIPGQLRALEASVRSLPDSVDKKILLDELQSRITLEKSKMQEVAASWSPPASAASYLAIATVVLAGLAILGPGIGFGRVTWLLLAVLCALMLNACVVRQSSALTRNALRVLLKKPNSHNSHGRSTT